MFATTADLDAAIDHVADAPSEIGTVELIVARPAKGERTVLASGELRPGIGLVGDNCPIGTRLTVGTAVIEVTSKPHNGCAKFADRYGIDAARWINSRKDLRLRGICAVVVEPGAVRTGDGIRRC